eukprot:gene19661-biopygen13041
MGSRCMWRPRAAAAFSALIFVAPGAFCSVYFGRMRLSPPTLAATSGLKFAVASTSQLPAMRQHTSNLAIELPVTAQWPDVWVDAALNECVVGNTVHSSRVLVNADGSVSEEGDVLSSDCVTMDVRVASTDTGGLWKADPAQLV